MTTYSIGETPASEIITALKSKPYHMSLTALTASTVRELVNQGIDSHLEACFVPSRGDSYEDEGYRLVCVVSPESMLVLLRRLHEDESGIAQELRSDILSTLDIEEV